MSDEKTINIKKSDLWKYSTFALVAIFLIGGIVVFANKSSLENVVNTGTQETGNAVDTSVFLDSSIYPSLGPENAENIVLEFSDFQCPYCALASGLPSWTTEFAGQYGDLIGTAENVKKMAENGKVRFIYISMSFLGQESVYAAQAGLCANKQGKFWEMHDEIFKSSTSPQENDGRYNKENLKKIAKKISSLDTGKFDECLDSDETLSDVKKVASTASQFASGTPTFYVDGRQVSASWNAISGLLN